MLMRQCMEESTNGIFRDVVERFDGGGPLDSSVALVLTLSHLDDVADTE
jgi:hypothetical protein